MYVFSKNKDRLASQGIVAVVPDYAALTRILDKSLTIEAARKVGFPAPRSEPIDSRETLARVQDRLGPPWVLKPRCSAHGENIVLVEEPAELPGVFDRLDQTQSEPLLQEYVQELSKRNYYVLVNRELELLSLFSPRVSRTRRTGVRTHCAAVESTTDVPYLEEIRALIRELGVWGGFTIQSIIDTRDGQPKIMEINPRFGHNLWYRTVLGLNEPLMLARIAHGRDPGEPPPFREGVLLLDPVWDLLHLLGQSLDQGVARARRKLGNRDAQVDAATREDIPRLLRTYREEYLARRDRRLSPLNRGFFSDPLPPLVRIARVFVEALQRRTG